MVVVWCYLLDIGPGSSYAYPLCLATFCEMNIRSNSLLNKFKKMLVTHAKQTDCLVDK